MAPPTTGVYTRPAPGNVTSVVVRLDDRVIADCTVEDEHAASLAGALNSWLSLLRLRSEAA